MTSTKKLLKTRKVVSQVNVPLNENNDAQKELLFKIGLSIVLLVIGIYLAVHFFGFQIVPSSDFAAFLDVGEHVLHGTLPVEFKRGPVVGVLQVLLSRVVHASAPDLTAGWLLNAILFPINLLLLWRIGTKLIGSAAIWVAIIAIVNPTNIQSLTDPIAETTMMFFVLITLYAIFKRSRLSYVAASVASMVRYECAALILAAFIVDVVEHKDRRQRFLAGLCLVLASLPLAFWMFETYLHWNAQEPTHYLKVFSPSYNTLSANLAEHVGMLKHLRMLWYVGFWPLAMPDPRADVSFAESLQYINQILVVLSFTFGTIWGLCKRNWNVIAVLLFFVPYVIVHSRYPYLLPRFYQTVYWMALLICCYGFVSAWKIFAARTKIPAVIIVGMQAFLIIIVTLWIIQLLQYIDAINNVCPIAASIPYIAAAALLAILALFIWRYRDRRAFTAITITACAALILISNQFAMAQILKDGQRNAEFKKLAEWLVANGKPGEKLAVYMCDVTRYYVPLDRRADIVRVPTDVVGEKEFVAKCRQSGIRYVVWATREGFYHDEYYRLHHLENMASLEQPRDNGPYTFVTRIDSKYGYVHVFRLSDSN